MLRFIFCCLYVFFARAVAYHPDENDPNIYTFSFCEQQLDWVNAQSHCLREGGRLPVINNYFMQQYIFTHIKPRVRLWIGLSDTSENGDGRWYWVDETAATYFYWAPMEPNSFALEKKQRCVQMNYNPEGQWDDASCAVKKPFVCQKLKREYRHFFPNFPYKLGHGIPGSNHVPHRQSHIPHRQSHIPHRQSHIPHRQSHIPHRQSHIPHRPNHISQQPNHIPQQSNNFPSQIQPHGSNNFAPHSPLHNHFGGQGPRYYNQDVSNKNSYNHGTFQYGTGNSDYRRRENYGYRKK